MSGMCEAISIEASLSANGSTTKNPNAARQDWKVGRIVQTYPRPDGLVRVVDVQVKDKVLKQPITRLSPLETQDIEEGI